MKAILLLGSTGSIGTQTLDVIAGAPERFRVEGLAARRSVARLIEQVARFRPRFVALEDPAHLEELRAGVPAGTEIFSGPQAVLELIAAADFELCVHGIVGSAGLAPSAAVLDKGRDLALANKESLVCAGEYLMDLARRRGAALLPVDSEHCAIAQCLGDAPEREVRRLYLTASGGALRDWPLERLAGATAGEALQHPTWDMGPRITVGSATLMNKALEVIEAHHLFGVDAERIRVVVHRQSIVHSMVEFVDGSVLAQMGPPDMRLPLHHALHHPHRAPSNLQGFDLDLFRELTFDDPDPERYPALELGFECVRRGGDHGARLNAADEVAVAAFLDGRVRFGEIVPSLAPALAEGLGTAPDVEQALAADAAARHTTSQRLAHAASAS
ncbi:MAG: 1-deoxy-D-xylulose-5-phosphate reductoisomerase [Planctomycetota bacterium]|jgi:1-deoxy-D-xylulose-5-phosphate reductoisomerase